MRLRSTLLAGLFLSAASFPALAQQCGGDFEAWKEGVSAEATAAGIGEAGHKALAAAAIDERCWRATGVRACSRRPSSSFPAA